MQVNGDSGARTHITHNITNLQDKSTYHGHEQVSAGNGSQLAIDVFGKSTISTSSKTLLLSNILYAPHIKRI